MAEGTSTGGAGRQVKAALLIVLLAGVAYSGMRLYNRIQLEKKSKAQVEAIQAKRDDDTIRETRERTRRTAETAQKFAPLLRQKAKAEDSAPASGQQTMPFAIPTGAKPSSESAPATAATSPDQPSSN